MYRTKQNVDKHVSNILGRLKDEKERNAKGYNIAKLYYEIKEYDVSRRYLAGFLSINEKFAPAHKLLGQLLEALCHTEKAIESYKRSYEIDDRQKDVLLKICELYCEVDVDVERAKYWADRAEKLFPKNDIVFRLRERIYSDGGGLGNTEELENLIASELAKRPGDPMLRTKLLKLYLEMGRVNEAYSHAVEVEQKVAYPDSLDWYQCLLEVFQTYSEQGGNGCSAFHQNLLAAQNALVALSLEKAKVSDCADILHKFDQSLYAANKQKPVATELKVFLEEMQAQFFTHAGTLLLKRAQLDHLGWTDARNMSGACYLASYATPPFDTHAPWFVKASDDEKRVHTNLYNMACYRASQAGHMISTVAVGDRHKWKQMIKQDFLSNQGCEKIFDSLFTMRQMKGSKETSYLMRNEFYTSFTPLLPSESDLKQYDVSARRYKSDSLHTHVWLSLQYYSSRDDTQPYYGDTVFDDLQYSTGQLETAAPETLCQLDIQAFLYAVVRCTAVRLDTKDRIMSNSSGQPAMFPTSLSEQLCTPEQAEWWTTAYKLYKNLAKEQLAKCRLTLQRGLEAVRLVGNHGVKPVLVVHLAKTFEEQAQDMKSRCATEYSSNVADVERQASHYWHVALKMLNKMNNNVGGASPKNCLFKYEGPTLSDADVKMHLDAGRYFMACQAMDAGCCEEAIEEFSKLNTADAAYHVAQMYRSLANEELMEASRNDVQDPSGMEQHSAFLEKARDSLYLCLDRVGSNRHHKLNSVLASDIDDVEAKINKMGLSPGPADQSSNGGKNTATPIKLTSRFGDSIKHSTPSAARHSLNFSLSTTNPATFEHAHIVPSPERLDAQLRALASSNDAILKRNDELCVANSSLVDEVKQLHNVIKKLEDKIDRFETQGKARLDAVQQADSLQQRAAACAHLAPGSPAPPLPAAAITTSIAGHIAPRPHLTPVRHLPAHAAGSPYYGYRPPEYEYAPYYQMYAPPPQPPLPAPYGYPAPAVSHAAALYKPPAHQSLTGDHHVEGQVDVEDDGDYYYEDDDEGDGNDENGAYGQQQRAAATTYHIPDSQLIQDWQYGSSAAAAAMEGKAALAYAPAQPAAVPAHPGYFSQIPPQQGIPGIFGQPPPSVATPPMPGPGYFSSPERPVATYGARYPTATASACAVQSAAASAGVPMPPMQLEPPKPGFVSITQPGRSPVAASISGVPAHTTLAPSTASTAAPILNITPVSLGVTTPMFKSGPTEAVAGITSPPAKPATAFPIKFAASPVPAYHNEEAKSIIQSAQPDDGDDDDVNEDSYQGPDFEPIIPLPAEVVVETGEENETVMFVSRAKLYRFTENQWKERGLGDLKILFNETSGQARIVMRREQVLKVCANHNLTGEMTVDFKSVSDRRVLTWIANDFSEGAPELEKFCIRFKTDDLGVDFKENFEAAVKKVAAHEKLSNKPAKPAVPAASAAKDDLFAKFKPKAGSWECTGCYVSNAAAVTVCPACGTCKPGTEKSAAATTSVASSITAAAGGGFKFGGSPVVVASGATSGFKFGSPVTATNTPTGFGSVPAAPTGISTATTPVGFGASKPTAFGTSVATTAATFGTASSVGFGASNSKPTTSASFNFGSPAAAPSSGSVFGVSKPAGGVAKPATAAIHGDAASGPLSALNPPKPGTWECDMCLVRNDPDDTVCQACEKPHPTAGRSAAPKPAITAGSGGGFTFGSPATPGASSFGGGGIFGGPPSSSAAPKPVISPPKFQVGGATPTSVPSFAATAASTASAATKPVFGSSISASTAGVTKPVFGSSMPVFGGITPLPVPGTTAATKSVFGSAAPARPSFGAAPVVATSTVASTSATSTKSIIGATSSAPSTTTTSTSGTFVFGDPTSKPVFGAPATSTKPVSAFNFASVKFGDSSSASAPASDLLKSFAEKSKESSSDVKTAEEGKDDNKPKLGGFTFNAKPVFQDDGTVARTTVKASPHKDATPPTEEKKNPFASFSFSPTKSVTTAATTSASGTFGGGMATSFASLAANVESKEASISQKSEFAGFSGAGQQIFQAKSPGKTDGTDEAVEEYEPDVDFKPLVPLPDLVQVKTGEEDEDKLFCQRARLYRHDPDTKQWKERGIGEIKILKNRTSGKCRVLMRREQVLKLCANHPITSEMVLKPMATSEKAFCWIAQDYSEEEMKTENLAIRFKTPDLAKKFKEVFEDCQKSVKDLPPTPEKSAANVPTSTTDGKKGGFGELFKPKTGDWECQGCYIQNVASVDRCPACGTTRPGATAAAAVPESAKPKPSSTKPKAANAVGSFGEKFKPKTGDWECSGCYINNAASVKQCPACNTMQPGVEPEQSSEISSSTTTGSGFGAFTFGSSGGPGFTFGTPQKPSSMASGFNFGTPNSVDSKPTGGFNFGTPSQVSTASTFGSPAKPETVKPKADAKSIITATPKVSAPQSAGFTFGMASSTFSFTPNKTADKPLDLSNPKTPQSPGEDGYYEHDEGDHILFEPLVHLEKVEVKTGEEDESIVYSHRAKLFRFVNSEWKERGIGDIKILEHNTTHKFRLIMRREQILKLCLNHAMTSDLELKEMINAQGKAWVWHAEDFSEGEGSHEKFAVKFRSKEIADEFRAAFDRVKDDASGSPDTSRDLTANEAVVKDTKPEVSSSIQNFSFKVENSKSESPAVTGFASSTPTSAGASSFGTAKGFTFAGDQVKSTPTSGADKSTAEGTPQSPHARARSLLMTLLDQPTGADGEDDVIIVGEEKPAPERMEKAKQFQLPCNFYSYEDKPSCPGCIGCADEDAEVIFVKEEIPPKEKIALAQSYQLPHSFYLYESRAPCRGCIGCDEEDLKARCITLKEGVALAKSVRPVSKKAPELPSSKNEPETVPDSTTSGPFSMFSASGGSEMSFATLSTQGGGAFTFGKKLGGDGDKPFAFAGAGASVFNKSATEDGEDGDVAPSNDIHFEPLVELPEIEVKTGEEDEEVVYSHRAKLFRFTDNQWKERGIGEMKLLRDPQTGKIRVLMRREQIHKIACNHQLTTEMHLKPLMCSEVSYCWNALDFTENEAKLEQFAVKFKTKELAQQFKAKFEECQAEIAVLESGERKVDESVTHSEDSEEEDNIVTSAAAVVTGGANLAEEMLASEAPESEGCFRSLEALIVSQSGDAVIPATVEADVVPESACITGDRGNPYYTAELNRSVESPISAEIANVTGDRGNPYYAAQLNSSVESPISAEIANVTGDRGNPHYAAQLNSSVESPISAEIANVTGDRGNPHYAAQLNSSVESPISAEIANYTGDRGNPYYAEELVSGTPYFADETYYTLGAGDPRGVEYSDGEIPEYFHSLEDHISQEEKRSSGDFTGSVDVIVPERIDYTGDAGNPYHTDDLDNLAERPSNYVETHESNLVTAYTFVGSKHSPSEDINQEELFVESTAHTTGDRGNVYYAAELDLKPSGKSLQQSVEDQMLSSGLCVGTVAAEEEGEVSAAGENLDETSKSEDAADTSIINEQQDDEDEDEDEDEENVQPLFTKRVTMMYSEGNEYKAKGMGDLNVLYDDDVNGMRISMQTDEELSLANHIICQEHSLQANEKKRFCEWTAKDFSTNDPVRRTFRVQFSSAAAVQEFRKIFTEGKNLAFDSDLREVADVSGEIDIPEVSGVAQEYEEYDSKK